jgi:deoxyribose-phosphate aldolase
MNKIFDFKKFLNKINESIEDTDLIGKIDYTLLNPSATEEEILQLCEKADKLGVKSVCVLPKMVKIAAEALEDSDVLVCTVISFPHGTDTTEQKLAETKQCIYNGSDECDMVLNYPLLQQYMKNAQDSIEDEDMLYDNLVNDILTLVDECHSHKNKDGNEVILKVIVESGLLSEDETAEATHVCLDSDADFIKTSTGMVAVGAELNKVQIMKNIIDEEGSNMKIKASGAIRSLGDIQKFAPYVDRFGVGFAAVDKIFGDSTTDDNSY